MGGGGAGHSGYNILPREMGPQGRHGPFQAFPGRRELWAGRGRSATTQPSAIATSSHCLKTLKAFEKERGLLPWLSGEGAAPAQGGQAKPAISPNAPPRSDKP